MPDERELRARLDLRDSTLRRLKIVTGVLLVVASALAGIFTGMAAGTTPRRKLIRVQPRAGAVRPKAVLPRKRPRVPPPPPLPPLGSQAAPAAPPAPAAPAQPPAAAPPAAPPVVVSGGS